MGPGNEPNQEVHDNPADETEPTNVLKIVRGLAPVDGEQVPQVVYYDTGVGTQGPLDKYVGGGLGSGLSQNIQQAYRFIAKQLARRRRAVPVRFQPGGLYRAFPGGIHRRGGAAE